jgi:5-keto 4-deoxyuronate isomerase
MTILFSILLALGCVLMAGIYWRTMPAHLNKRQRVARFIGMVIVAILNSR